MARLAFRPQGRPASARTRALYDLRHTFASVGAGGGLSLPIIGRLLGHTQPRTTQRYAHLADDPLREAAEKITTVITGAGKRGRCRAAARPAVMKKKKRGTRTPTGAVARWGIWQALEGDPAILGRRLLSGRALPEELELATDLIAGKIKPRRLRSGQPSEITNEYIAETVFYIEFFRPNWLRKQFIPDVAKAFKVSTKHVYNVLAEYKNDPVQFDYPNQIGERILARK